jgi:hypothetical protein
MTITISNAQLLMLDREIQSMRTSVLALFLASKINQFYNNNKVRINSALEKRDALWKEFCVIEEDGKLKMEGEGAEQKLVLKEELRRHEFEKKMVELMNHEITIEA